MSRNHRSIDFDDNMMYHIFDADSGNQASNNNSAQQRKNRMKRTEELSHSLDDGLNDLPHDGYDRHVANRGRQAAPHYDDMDDDDDYIEDEFIDDYYYQNNPNPKQFDERPKSYNEKFSNNYAYDDYQPTGNFSRNRYSLNETTSNNNRYQQSPIAQQKQSTLRRPQPQSSGSGGTGHHGSNKHILFNDEDDVHYMSEKKPLSSSSKTKPSKSKEPATTSSSSSLFSSKKKPSKEDLAKPEKSAQQVMKAKLKIQNVSSDDSVLHTRSNHNKLNTLLRHHSVEAKLPSHGSDRGQMSPTIMEEIEFEMQDVDTETEKEIERELEPLLLEPSPKSKEKAAKEKASKEKKSDSAPSTPTTKKSFKAHLTNHKKLFKVPDIDLNHFSKFSCFFSSNKNIAALKGSKKLDVTSKSAEALNEILSKESPKSSPTTKSPPASPKKLLKSESKSERLEKIEKVDEKLDKRNVQSSRGKTTGSGSTIQSSSEGFKDDDNSRSSSDTEFESQAMKVVRTIGQAFEVCHKLSVQKKQDNNDDISEINSELDQSDIQNLSDFDEPKKALETTPILQDTPLKLQRPTQLENLSTPLNNLMAPPSPNKVTTPSDDSNKENSREFHILKEQLQQQTQQTKQALAQLILVREQLLTETNARIEAQARTQQLLQQNRELLEHIASLSGLNESDRPGLSSANIGMAPQSQLPLYLQTLSMMGNSNMMKQNDYMQNEDMKNNNSPHKINQNGNMPGTLNIDSFQIFQNTMQAYNQLNQMNQQKQMGMPQQHQELYQLNQELLNRLKNLNVGFQTPSTPVSATFTPSPTTGLPNFPADSNFMFTNAAAQNFLNNNNNNINSTVNASSPLGTLNRSSSTYSTISPIGDSFDRSLDNLNNNHNNSISFNDATFIKPLSQVGTVSTLDNDGRVKVLVPVEYPQQSNRDRDRYRVEDDFFGDRRGGGSSGTATLQRPPTQPRALTPILSRGEKKSQGNTVTLKVTDEAGNVTNQRKLPAQPSFITRSTSEKVSNRSQIMSHVQRTQWARHTTK